MLPSRRKNGPKARGRPLGFLVAWLKAGRLATVNSKRAHSSLKLSRRDRVAARLEFEAIPGAHDFLEHEREQRGDEETEPWRQP